MAFGGRPWSAPAFNTTCSDKPRLLATFTQFNRVASEVNITEQDIRRRRSMQYVRQAWTSRRVHTVKARRPDGTPPPSNTSWREIWPSESAGKRRRRAQAEQWPMSCGFGYRREGRRLRASQDAVSGARPAAACFAMRGVSARWPWDGGDRRACGGWWALARREWRQEGAGRRGHGEAFAETGAGGARRLACVKQSRLGKCAAVREIRKTWD
jgi:hypothetical protein